MRRTAASESARQFGLPPVDGSEMPVLSLAARLAGIDWDFPTRTAASGIESMHPYPAKFVAELPRSLLRCLPMPPGTAVLDPFCGSGTTLVESQRRGLSSVGIDLNPIACLIARVKTSSLPRELETMACSIVKQAETLRAVSVPKIPNLDHWFAEDIQLALSALTEVIAAAPPGHRDALRLAFSSIVVRVSRQESDTRYAAIKKQVTTQSVFTGFLRAAKRIERALQARDYGLSPSTVIEGDTLDLNLGQIPDRIGLVVTSPPYPNAYEYWLYHKYRMYWLGMDPIAVKEREVGARAHFFKRDHHTAADFVRQISRVFAVLQAVLVPGGLACFVVGRSRIHGEIIDNAEIIEDVGLRKGFSRVFSTERTLATNRKSFNPSYGNNKTEAILVLRLAQA